MTSLLIMVEVESTCLTKLLPDGPIQINIPRGKFDFWGSKLLPGHTVTLADRCLPGTTIPPKAYLIIVNGKAELDNEVKAVSCNHGRWFPSVFTVICLWSRNASIHEVDEFSRNAIQLLWSKSVYNLAIYVIDKDIVFKSDPFAPGNKCGREVINLYRSDCKYSLLPPRASFPNWCVLHVTTRDTPPFSFWDVKKKQHAGLDVDLIRLLASRSNLKTEWHERPSQQVGSYTQAHAYYENLSRNEVYDVAIGGSVLSPVYRQNVTYVYSHMTQYLYFYVADSQELLGWRMLVAMFPGKIWLYIFITLVVTTAVLSVLGEGGPSEYFLVVLGIILEESVRVPGGRLRLLMLFVLLPFYYISSTYTTTLNSYSTTPPSSRGVRTLEDLAQANLSILLSDTNKILTDRVVTRQVRELLRTSWPSPGLKEGARLVIRQRKYALVERDIEMSAAIARHRYPIHPVDYKITAIRNALVHPKGSKYERRIHDMVIKSLEYGFLDKWWNLAVGDKLAKPANFTKRPINIHDVQPAFVLLLIGHSVAAIAFIFEKLIHAMTLQNYRNRRSP